VKWFEKESQQMNKIGSISQHPLY